MKKAIIYLKNIDGRKNIISESTDIDDSLAFAKRHSVCCDIIDVPDTKNESDVKNIPDTKQRIFFDIDGTLGEWNTEASFEDVASPGYFAQIKPMKNSIETASKMQKKGKYEIYILSAAFEDGHSVMDKNKWLDKYLENIDENHRIFVPYSRKKTEYVKEKTGCLKDNDILIDDYTKNLSSWHGIAIKMLNGINGSKGTWNGYVISHRMDPEKMEKTIEALAEA